jgi:Do/DeqQ family serine protease
MSEKKIFYSKKFFVFNLLLVGVIAGFVVAMITFGCSTGISSGETAFAQEKSDSAIQVPPSMEEMQNSFRSVARKALPVVVEIKVVEVVTQQVPQGRGWPWDFLFPEQQNGPNGTDAPEEREYRNQGLGSGVIVRSDGDTHYVLTNEHVAGKADEIMVVLNDGREFPAKLVGGDERMDLAMVSFEAEGEIPIADLGDSDELQIGDWVIAVGSPFGFVSSVTAGIVSAKGRSGPQNNISDFIQTDAAINQGNSGGALVNIYGEVVGINTWIAAPTGGNVGLGFSIPINNAKRAIDDFINKGEIQYGWLGVTVTDIFPGMADSLKIQNRSGAFIHNVYIGSPAEKGGIRPGDFVFSIDKRPVRNRDDLVRMVGELPAGARVDFSLVRNGNELTVTVEIGKRENSEAIAGRMNMLWPGLTVVPIDDEVRSRLELDRKIDGVVAAGVDRGTKAYIAGLRPYDVIFRINDTDIETVADFYKAINEPNVKEYKINYVREGSEFFAGIVR